MTVITTLLLLIATALGSDTSTAHGTAVYEAPSVVSTVSIGDDGSLTAFAG